MLWEQINVDTILKKDKRKRHSLFLTIIIQTPYFKCVTHIKIILLLLELLLLLLFKLFYSEDTLH